MKSFAIVFSLTILLTACSAEHKTGDNSGNVDTSQSSQQANEDALAKLEAVIGSDTSLMEAAKKSVQELSEKKIPSSACFLNNLVFSPTVYIEKDARSIKDSLNAANFFNDKKKYTWGKYQGSGEKIQMTNEEYYSKFIWDRDYTKADTITLNFQEGRGNTKSNSRQIYPDSYVADFHFNGTEKNGNMDWSTLRLIYRKLAGKYCLVAIIKDQWSI